ncbi:TIGR04222 domain-containing membrane protein [Montanilutibacter psychrotolerans]|uniref:TIGR04222 domain-containing membrane protein n=1 Tax=Montanilutibacter psychrotolerans TaxID=1327343 RepID=UPI00168082E1|nr:TIGR04222 domain-containing membrane protein [Lysobacter psychrotolerans]
MSEGRNQTPPANWTATQQALWQRLQDYDFGDRNDGGAGGRPRGFAARLAHTLGCSQASAESALIEYRRFCFLAVIGSQEVTPSRTVDAVWHLHLTDSREYWERFCPHVLGVPLHHLASDGSSADTTRHRAQYQATWDAYRMHFGPPPETFWPPPERHARASAPRMPLSQVWPAPDTGSASLLVCGVLMALVWGFGALSAAEPNPLEWRGGWFLLFQLVLSALTIVAARRLRRALRDRGSVGVQAESPTPVELGFLARGAPRAADVVVADLLQRGALRVDLPRDAAGVAHPATRSWLRAAHGGDDLPVELRDALATVRMDERIHKALTAITESQESVRSALERKRLQFDAGTAHAYALMAASLPAFAVVSGLAKIAIGLERDRPVGLLTVLTTLMAMVVVGFARIPVWHTRAGAAALHLASKRVSGRANDDDLLQQVALAGTPVLIGSAYADYHLARTPPPGSATSDGVSSCGGSTGSGDGGGGGCGGGGCGGCGG